MNERNIGVVARFFRYVKCSSQSGDEREMCDLIARELQALGGHVEKDELEPISQSNGYNVFAKFTGDLNLEPILLCAHLDTVSHNGTIIPEIDGDRIVSKGDTILGADDKSGVAAIIQAVNDLKGNGKSNRPFEVLFTVGEEIGLVGSSGFTYTKVKSRSAVVFDSSEDFGSIINQSPSAVIINFQVIGVSAHAAIRPEEGINALKVAADLISQMELGRVDEFSTVNVANFKAQGKTNVVSDLATFEVEVRSFDEGQLKKIMTNICNDACRIANQAGAKLTYSTKKVLTQFLLPETHPLVEEISRYMKAMGLNIRIVKTYGGSDTNNINLNGIPAINVSTGMKKSHSNDEYIMISDLERTTQIVYKLLTGE